MAFHDQISQAMALHHYTNQQLTGNILPEHLNHTSPEVKSGPPTWLNNAILRQQNRHYTGENLGHNDSMIAMNNENQERKLRHHNDDSMIALNTENQERKLRYHNDDSMIAMNNENQERKLKLRHHNDDSMIVMNNENQERKLRHHNDESLIAMNNENQERKLHQMSELVNDISDVGDWQNAKCKADVLSHPLYDQLLAAHVSCLRIATPVDQLPRIDAQLAQAHHNVQKYVVLGHSNNNQPLDDKDLDQFMTNYVLLLSSFREQLQQHVRVHAMEAVMACWELEQSLQSLTGIAPGEGTGSTMSDDDDQGDSETNMFEGSLDGQDSMGFGPLVPTESERSLIERVRQELKHELKQGYKEKIVDIREEILRKRRAGKLPGDTTSLLKAWWQSHSKWPYPTEEDKARLVQETGLQLKQINNWFINQRKRNWHSNPSSSTVPKSKRKR